MLQRTDLNLTRTPAHRGQVVGTRPESDYASSTDTSALTGRVDTLETGATDHESRIAELEAQVADLLSRMTPAEATLVDHESRITALEP